MKQIIPRVFVDTSFWLNFLLSSEPYYKVSRKWAKKNITIFVTSNLVLYETLDVLAYKSKVNLKKRKEIAKSFYELWNKYSEFRQLIKVDDAIIAKAEEIYFKYKDKSFGFTDCTSFSIMDREGIFDAAAFDRHFKEAGKNIVPVIF